MSSFDLEGYSTAISPPDPADLGKRYLIRGRLTFRVDKLEFSDHNYFLMTPLIKYKLSPASRCSRLPGGTNKFDNVLCHTSNLLIYVEIDETKSKELIDGSSIFQNSR
jgi:hypothetical protein